MVPNTYFGAGNNSLGMTSSSWQSCAGGYPSCQEPFGACTAVASGGVYDQFTAFRSSTMAKVSPVGSNINCSFLFNDAFSAPYGSYWTTFMSCDYGTGYLAININMNVSVVNMTYGWGVCTFAMSHILISHLDASLLLLCQHLITQIQGIIIRCHACYRLCRMSAAQTAAAQNSTCAIPDLR